MNIWGSIDWAKVLSIVQFAAFQKVCDIFMIILSIIYFFFPPNFLFNCQLWPTLCNPMDCSTPGLPDPTISRSLPKFMSLCQWCYQAISSSDVLVSFCPQSFSASETFVVSRLLPSDDQNTGASASTSVLPVNIQGLFLLGLTGLISLMSKDRSMKRILFLLHPWLHPTTTVMF